MLVKEIKNTFENNLEELGKYLDENCEANVLDKINWAEFSYRPKVEFKIAHNNSAILLKYNVSEKHVRALETKTNGDVYKDTCVEFFISMDGINYYNLEFNCIGTKHMGYGKGRNDRELITPEIVENISVLSSLGNKPFEEITGENKWEITIVIPQVCFIRDSLKTFSGLKAKANFYKCGDETSEPHFVTFFPIHTPTPDYHQPEFFGEIVFE